MGARVGRAVADLARFAWAEALACIFPAWVFAALAVTRAVHVPGIPRYDLMLLLCVAMQVVMVATHLETLDELAVICVFHVLGLALEMVKVAQGSWAYPDDAWTKVAGVPLYSGFMYASVASYICQAWRRLDLALSGWPRGRVTVPLAVALYANFFTHHWMPDLRWPLLALTVAVLARSRVYFVVGRRERSMPVVVSFALVAGFIYLGENIATFLGAWQYPNQAVSWHLVHPGKFSSWLLLFVVSAVVVAQLKRFKAELERTSPEPDTAQSSDSASPAAPATPSR